MESFLQICLGENVIKFTLKMKNNVGLKILHISIILVVQTIPKPVFQMPTNNIFLIIKQLSFNFNKIES